jgi:hypothetical protein
LEISEEQGILEFSEDLEHKSKLAFYWDVVCSWSKQSLGHQFEPYPSALMAAPSRSGLGCRFRSDEYIDPNSPVCKTMKDWFNANVVFSKTILKRQLFGILGSNLHSKAGVQASTFKQWLHSFLAKNWSIWLPSERYSMILELLIQQLSKMLIQNGWMVNVKEDKVIESIYSTSDPMFCMEVK